MRYEGVLRAFFGTWGSFGRKGAFMPVPVRQLRSGETDKFSVRGVSKLGAFECHYAFFLLQRTMLHKIIT